MTRTQQRAGTETCGTCVYRYTAARGNTRAPKCRLRDTRSDATDCRASWPACPKWQAKS